LICTFIFPLPAVISATYYSLSSPVFPSHGSDFFHFDKAFDVCYPDYDPVVELKTFRLCDECDTHRSNTH